MTGIIKSYSAKNGYGFIVSDGKDYRFKTQSIEMRLPPTAGMLVSFIPFKSEKGYRAMNVRNINGV